MKQAIHSSTAFVCHIVPSFVSRAESKQNSRIYRSEKCRQVYSKSRPANRFSYKHCFLVQPFCGKTHKRHCESEPKMEQHLAEFLPITCTGVRAAHHGLACKALMADSWGLSGTQKVLCFPKTLAQIPCAAARLLAPGLAPEHCPH